MISLFIFLQCSSLLDQSQYDDFVEEISEEYDEIREDHYEHLKVWIIVDFYDFCLMIRTLVIQIFLYCLTLMFLF